MYQNIKLKHERRSDNGFKMGITDESNLLQRKLVK